MNIVLFLLLSMILKVCEFETKITSIKNLITQLNIEFYNDETPPIQRDEKIHHLLLQIEKIYDDLDEMQMALKLEHEQI